MVAPEKEGDPERPWIGEMWVLGNGSSARVVSELFGDEKNEALRPGSIAV